MGLIDANHRQQMRLAIECFESWGNERPRRWLALYGSLGAMQHMIVNTELKREYRAVHNQIRSALEAKGVNVPGKIFRNL